MPARWGDSVEEAEDGESAEVYAVLPDTQVRRRRARRRSTRAWPLRRARDARAATPRRAPAVGIPNPKPGMPASLPAARLRPESARVPGGSGGTRRGLRARCSAGPPDA